MRIAFISDIHGNLQAWKAVHSDILAQDVDRIICLGDIVGYGPSPAQVLTEVYESVHHFVLGNHDAVIAGSLEPNGFNSYARELIDIHRDNLGEKAVDFFRGLPLAVRNSTFRCSHGNPATPRQFGYVFGEEEARAAWRGTEHRLMFVGHTHRAALHELADGDMYRSCRPAELPVYLDDDTRYIINTGSVGMPRDEDFRASYTIYDSDEDSVSWQRVAYDIDAFIDDVEASIQEDHLTDFLLKKIEAERHPPIRERIDFTPGESSLSPEVEEEREIEQIKARAARWRWTAMTACIGLTVALAAFYSFWKAQPRTEIIGRNAAAQRDAEAESHPVPLDCLPDRSFPEGQAPPGWEARLGDARHQMVQFGRGEVTLLSRGDDHPIELMFPRIAVQKIGRVELDLEAERSEDFTGERPALIMDLIDTDGAVSSGTHRESMVPDGTVLSKEYTMTDLPPDAAALRIRIRGRFGGSLRIRRLHVTLHPDSTTWLAEHGPVDINSADADTLERLPGIGRTRAREIINHRLAAGGFTEKEDLLDVPDVGPKTLDTVEPHIKIGEYEESEVDPLSEDEHEELLDY
ncbi:MAG: metallophosphoesterase [Planctomycetota bacterium]